MSESRSLWDLSSSRLYIVANDLTLASTLYRVTLIYDPLSSVVVGGFVSAEGSKSARTAWSAYQNYQSMKPLH